MKVHIDRDELGRVLGRVQSIVERKGSHPLLGHVLVDARKGGPLRMTATDSEVAYIGDASCNVTKSGTVAVDAANFFQIVRALPELVVNLSIERGKLLIESGTAKFRLPAADADSFPALPEFSEDAAATLPAPALRRLAESVSFAVASDDVRFGLNGAHLESLTDEEGSIVRMVATDGHRLSAADAFYEGELQITPRTLIPRKALAVIRKLLDSDETVSVAFGDGAIRITRTQGETRNETLWFRLIEGEFPDYHAIVPKDPRFSASVHRMDMIGALKRTMVLVTDKARSIRLGFGQDDNGGCIHIETAHIEVGAAEDQVPAELSGFGDEEGAGLFSTGMNARYLVDALSAMSGERVHFRTDGAYSPFLLEDPDDADCFFVVMPLRLP